VIPGGDEAERLAQNETEGGEPPGAIGLLVDALEDRRHDRLAVTLAPRPGKDDEEETEEA